MLIVSLSDVDCLCNLSVCTMILILMIECLIVCLIIGRNPSAIPFNVPTKYSVVMEHIDKQCHIACLVGTPV